MNHDERIYCTGEILPEGFQVIRPTSEDDECSAEAMLANYYVGILLGAA